MVGSLPRSARQRVLASGLCQQHLLVSIGNSAVARSSPVVVGGRRAVLPRLAVHHPADAPSLSAPHYMGRRNLRARHFGSSVHWPIRRGSSCPSRTATAWPSAPSSQGDRCSRRHTAGSRNFVRAAWWVGTPLVLALWFLSSTTSPRPCCRGRGRHSKTPRGRTAGRSDGARCGRTGWTTTAAASHDLSGSSRSGCTCAIHSWCASCHGVPSWLRVTPTTRIVEVPAFVVATILVAAFSWHFYERPLDLKRHLVYA